MKNIKFQIFKLFIFTLSVSFIPVKMLGQNATDLKFSEILVMNDSLNVDDFGENSSWIEIFNTSYNTVEIGGCYLTDEMQNPTKYWIPTGDPITKIPARCYILFWADGKPTRGILHLNFELRDADTIALFDANGRTLIDKLAIVKPQKSNMSYGFMEAADEYGNISYNWMYLDKITPSSNNDHSRKVSSGEQFVKYDPSGIGMATIAMTVVFISLALLYMIFKTTGSYFMGRARKTKKMVQTESADDKSSEDISGEVSAAIAMALHLFQSEIHDEENTVLTIKKVSRTYSPWSSKIYTLRKYPQ
jgi:Na+-transporting methylmalonyl-CoA/oxaloacetate decarboxylase gamma subunit